MVINPIIFRLLILLVALSLSIPSMGQDAQNHSKEATARAVELLMSARQAAKDVEDREQRDVSMGDIAQDLGKLGVTTAARETFALIIDDKWHDYSLKPFLEIQLRAKRFEEAQLTIAVLKTIEGKAEGLCAFASAQWQFGSQVVARKALAEAESIFAANRKELTNAVFLEQLALTQDKLGEVGKANHTKREANEISGGRAFIVDRFDISWLDSDSGKLRQTGRTQIKDGDLPAARLSLQRAANEIESVPHIGDRAILLYMIGSDQVAAGDRDGARDTFLRADEKAEGLPDINRDLILRDVVREQATAGYIEDSFQAVTNIRDTHLKWQALHGIAVSQVQQISLEFGLETAEQIQSESEYDMTLVDIAQILGQQNRFGSIHGVAESIHSPYMKSRAFIEAAESIAGLAEPEDL